MLRCVTRPVGQCSDVVNDLFIKRLCVSRMSTGGSVFIELITTPGLMIHLTVCRLLALENKRSPLWMSLVELHKAFWMVSKCLYKAHLKIVSWDFLIYFLSKHSVVVTFQAQTWGDFTENEHSRPWFVFLRSPSLKRFPESEYFAASKNRSRLWWPDFWLGNFQSNHITLNLFHKIQRVKLKVPQ